MEERHEWEQYFFDTPTLDRLADLAARYPQPCCLCAPRLGQTLEAHGVACRTLDRDTRFASLAGFRPYDITRPAWTGEVYGLIVCDPPFFSLSLTGLLHTIRLLSRYDPAQPLLISYLTRRAAPFLRAFAAFGLVPTDFYPSYVTVDPSARNEIAFFSNVDVS